MFKRHAIASLILIGILTGIFTLTRPDQLPSVMLVVVFMLLYALLASAMMIVSLAINKLGQFGWKTAGIRRVSYSSAALPVFLLLLQSIGQLTWRDLLLSVAFAALGYFYYTRFASGKREQST